MSDKYRIRELALNKDGSNVWFYPQLKKEKTVTKGFFWWKKTEQVVEWQNFYLDNGKAVPFSKKHLEESTFSHYVKVTETVVAFRNFCEAAEWVKKIINKEKEENERFSEQYYKYIGSSICAEDDSTIKTHEIK